MKFLLTLILIFFNFKSATGSVLNSSNTMTCFEFFMLNSEVYNGKQSKLSDEEITYLQLIFDKDVPSYNFTGEYIMEEDFKCLNGICSNDQITDDKTSVVSTFKEEDEQFGKHLYSTSSLYILIEGLNKTEHRYEGKMICDEPLPEFYLIDKN